MDGNPSYPKVIAGLKQERKPGRRCLCRTCPYLNNVVEIVFTQLTKPNVLAARMSGNYVNFSRTAILLAVLASSAYVASEFEPGWERRGIGGTMNLGSRGRKIQA